MSKTIPQYLPFALITRGRLDGGTTDVPPTNGWLYFTSGVGNWGTDYPLRAMGNMLGPGWNRPQDAVYPLSQKDASGDEYNGTDHKYVMHFDKGQFPPVKAFWSITLVRSRLLLRAELDQPL